MASSSKSGRTSAVTTKELTRLRRMFQEAPNMRECPTCNHWYQPTLGSGATLYPCMREDHRSKECPDCHQCVCDEWSVKECRKTSATQYLEFLKETAANGVFHECCLCGGYWPPEETLWCTGHTGSVCHACVPEFTTTLCGGCLEGFCSLCVADDMQTCPGPLKGECHNQLCRDCQGDGGRCIHCEEADMAPAEKKSRLE